MTQTIQNIKMAPGLKDFMNDPLCRGDFVILCPFNVTQS